MMHQFPGDASIHQSLDSLRFSTTCVETQKKEARVMLLCNFDASSGHCDGTRYIVPEIATHILEAMIATCPHVGEKPFIPRTPIFPAFAVMANKSMIEERKDVHCCHCSSWRKE